MIGVWICTGILVVLVVWQTVLFFHLGKKYAAVETSLERTAKRLAEGSESLRLIPNIEKNTQTLLDAYLEDRRRLNSVLPKALWQVAELWKEVYPTRSDAPHTNGNGGESWK